MREKTSFVKPLNERKIMDEKKRQLWRFVIQTAISILTAIATALGVTSCMAPFRHGRLQQEPPDRAALA